MERSLYHAVEEESNEPFLRQMFRPSKSPSRSSSHLVNIVTGFCSKIMEIYEFKKIFFLKNFSKSTRYYSNKFSIGGA